MDNDGGIPRGPEGRPLSDEARFGPAPDPDGDTPSAPRRQRRALWLQAIPVVLLAALAVLVLRADPRALAQRETQLLFHRPITIGAARIVWPTLAAPWTPILELRDVRLANGPGGSVPDMLSVPRMTVGLELAPLLRGRLRPREIAAEHAVLVLERDAANVGNWHGTLAGPLRPEGLVVSLTDARITYRGSSGAVQVIVADTARAQSAGANAPVSLAVEGRVNDVKLRLTGTASNITAASTVTATLAGEGDTLSFDGTIANLPGMDGIAGRLRLDAPKPGALAPLLGVGPLGDVPLRFAGTLTGADAFWRVAEATGRLGGSEFTGSLSLSEGDGGRPDDVAADLDFADLDLAPFIGGLAWLGSPDGTMHADTHPPITVALRISARQARFDAAQLTGVDLDASVVPGRWSLGGLSFRALGGTWRLSGAVENAATKSTHAQFAATVIGLDAAQLIAAAGWPDGRLSGTLDSLASLDMAGETPLQALQASQGWLVLSLQQGSVMRELIEQAPGDWHNLLRRNARASKVACLLGVVELHNGVATLGPLRLRMPDQTLSGGGQIDFNRDALDLVLRGDTGSSGLFAFDSPLQIGGSPGKPTLQPARRFNPRSLDAQAAAALGHLTDAQKALANGQPCAK